MLIIGTYNIQNKFYLKKYNGIEGKQDNVILLNELLEKYHLNILGTQEMTSWYLKRCQKFLKNYHIVGRYRYPNIILKKFNEANSIITNYEVIKTKTLHLPFLPTITPRIITSALIKNEEGQEILFFNTHLSRGNSSVQKRQLNFIYKLLLTTQKPLILTGDFNMTIDNPNMKDFIHKLKKLNISRIPVLEKTYKNHTKEKAIDHIFISCHFDLVKFQIIKDPIFHSTSDHYPIIAFLKINN